MLPTIKIRSLRRKRRARSDENTRRAHYYPITSATIYYRYLRGSDGKDWLMNIINTLKKIFRGEDLDWHNPLPPVLGPDETLTTCSKCAITVVITKGEQRTPYYCWACR